MISLTQWLFGYPASNARWLGRLPSGRWCATIPLEAIHSAWFCAAMLSCSIQISVGKPSESLRRLVRSNRSDTIVGSGEAVRVRTDVGVGVLVRVAVGDKVRDGVGESKASPAVLLASAACAFFARMAGTSVHPSARDPINTKPAETNRIRH